MADNGGRVDDDGAVAAVAAAAVAVVGEGEDEDEDGFIGAKTAGAG